MKYLPAIFLLSLFFSCKNKSSQNNTKEVVTNETQTNPATTSDDHHDSLSIKPQFASFVYQPEAGEYKASVKTLQMSDVENLMKNELEIMRNEIFARHGYTFNNKKELRQYFDHQSWYSGVSDDVKAELTPLEKKNIALILRLEDYADQHGDDFGR